MGDEAYGGDLAFLVSFAFLAACLFVLYVVAFKFDSVITDEVTPVAKFKSASSRTKILHLIVLCPNLQILPTETRILKT